MLLKNIFKKGCINVYLVEPLIVTELLLAHAVDGGAHAAQICLREKIKFEIDQKNFCVNGS